MADSCSSSKSEAKRVMAILRERQLQSEEKRDEILCQIRKGACEDLVFKDKTKTADNGNVTKHIRCTDAEVNSTGEPVDINFSATKRARVIRTDPSQQPPSFVKVLHGSELSSGKFLDVPTEFGNEHFPRRKGSLLVVNILLVDEHEQEYMMDYSFCSHRFLGRWRDFYIKHKLSHGDALAFHQIENFKFKLRDLTALLNGSQVHIVRAYKSTETTETNGIINLDSDDNSLEDGTQGLSYENTLAENQAERSNDNLCSGVPLNNKFSQSILKFEDIKGFKDFKIDLNGNIIDEQVPEHVRVRYYKLCCTQRKFLHERLIKKLNSNQVAEMIKKTVHMVEATKAVDISTSLHQLESMGKTLKSFEDLGMGVSFLRDNINQLVRLLSEHQTVTESKKRKLDRIEDEKTSLRQEVSMIDKLTKSATARKSWMGCLETEAGFLKKRSKEVEFKFKEIVDYMCLI